MTLMLKTVALDKRQQIYDSLCKLTESPRGALEFTRELADNTEGKPTQKHEVSVPRTTIFKKDPARPFSVRAFASPGSEAKRRFADEPPPRS
jgi:hypothetical protein